MTVSIQNERRPLELQSTHLQTCATSYGKERMTQKATLIARAKRNKEPFSGFSPNQEMGNGQRVLGWISELLWTSDWLSTPSTILFFNTSVCSSFSYPCPTILCWTTLHLVHK